ncbi:TIR domain-containing protein [Cryptosporangium sp. NPDC051539]|uniref:TIR domain-containing protein n=1 Tax=Cryptosporangium sp. NPDC051539 TaxID=3363962 RepID=UPI0037B60242
MTGPAPSKSERYDVCLSYASEQGAYVGRVASDLRSRGVRVYYDQFETVNTWGKDLYQHLSRIYGDSSRYCVVFASKDYARKVITNHELRNAQSRALSENREYVLPARFDDTKLPGIPATIAYIDLRGMAPSVLAEHIQAKLAGAELARSPSSSVPDPSTRYRLWMIIAAALVFAGFVTAVALHVYGSPTTSANALVLTGHTGEVTAVAFSPDGETIATASRDLTVRLWDTSTGQTIRIIAPAPQSPNDPTTPVPAIAFSPDGKTLATTGSDGIALRNTATGKTTRTLAGHTGEVTAVAFSPDGETIATASRDHTVRLWDTTTGKTTHILAGHTREVTAVAFSRNGGMLASASGDDTARLWDTATGKFIRAFVGHRSAVFAVAFSRTGDTLATASDDGTARLWDTASAQTVRTLTGHRGAVYAVAYSLDGTDLATAGADRTARLWSTLPGRDPRTFAGHKRAVLAVAFNPHKQILATASADGTARLWPLGQIE